jgi:AcrR family transcriptional regulator
MAGSGKIAPMGQTDHPLPLRERKKIRTRENIRRAAVRLIESNGYANTTIEQIAEAAEVSPSTFFRYFSSKQSVLMTDDIDRLTVSALASQPADVPTIQAFRRALQVTWADLSEDERRFEIRCRRLVLSIPELGELQHVEHRRSAAHMGVAECRRLARDPDDFEVHVFFGALLGAVLTALSTTPDMPRAVFRALDFVEAGLPLPQSHTTKPGQPSES